MKKCLIVFSLITLTACRKTEIPETEFYFSEAQPVNDSELNTLPARYLGRYEGERGDTLTITQKDIFFAHIFTYSISKDSLKRQSEIENAKLKAEITQYKYLVKEDNDSVYFTCKYQDTLFSFSNSAKAKRINSQVVLSYKDSVFWKVSLLSLKGDSLSLRSLTRKSDYEKLKYHVKDIQANKDTSMVQLKPTRREFMRILKLKLEDNLKFRKINN